MLAAFLTHQFATHVAAAVVTPVLYRILGPLLLRWLERRGPGLVVGVLKRLIWAPRQSR